MGHCDRGTSWQGTQEGEGGLLPLGKPLEGSSEGTPKNVAENQKNYGTKEAEKRAFKDSEGQLRRK